MDLITAVKATYEVIGQEISDLALQTIVAELSQYPPQMALLALTRCRKELRRVSLTDILDRVPGGHPGAEEAWSIVAPCLSDENVTVVWTRPMREAFCCARPLADDPIAARMAFKEVYERVMRDARSSGVKPDWIVSLGHDVAGRERPLIEAVQQGKLSQVTAQRYIPSLECHVSINLPEVQGFQV